eukprot:6053465-Pleurochrysis_carterae.AAC.2
MPFQPFTPSDKHATTAALRIQLTRALWSSRARARATHKASARSRTPYAQKMEKHGGSRKTSPWTSFHPVSSSSSSKSSLARVYLRRGRADEPHKPTAPPTDLPLVPNTIACSTDHRSSHRSSFLPRNIASPREARAPFRASRDEARDASATDTHTQRGNDTHATSQSRSLSLSQAQQHRRRCEARKAGRNAAPHSVAGAWLSQRLLSVARLLCSLSKAHSRIIKPAGWFRQEAHAPGFGRCSINEVPGGRGHASALARFGE